jgi:peptide/nickel transport system ATP-binding protein
VAIDRADRILVMKQGEVVEQGPPRQILANPAPDYTRALIAAAPAFARPRATRQVRCNARTDPAPAQRRQDLQPAQGEGRRPHFVALQDLSLQVYPGQTLAIVGESGSGKSTALRIALGLEKPPRARSGSSSKTSPP